MVSNKEQEYILEILIEIDRVCRKNNIPYALSYGSTLGIFNFKGFIPWDKDADIIIPYDSIMDFINACQKDLDKSRFILDCFELNKKYDLFIPMKIKRLGTEVEEKFDSKYFVEKTEYNGIFVDIQPFVNVPDDYTEYLKTLKDGYRKILLPHIANCLTFKVRNIKRKEKIKEFEKEYHLKYKNSKYTNQTPLAFSQYKVQENRKPFLKDIIYPFKEYEFEGYMFYSFNNIKEFCICCYGEDSIKPELYPEEEKIKSLNKLKLI